MRRLKRRGEPVTRRRRNALRKASLFLVAVLGVSIVAIYAWYLREMRVIRTVLISQSGLAETQRGPMEYATGGNGAPVLVVHGAGGGYDQGRLIADVFLSDGYRWIAPSRFGYLRTPIPPDASTAAQGEAFAALLDALDVKRVAVLAMSGGVPPALQFAANHPERVTALILLSSAPYTPLTDEEADLPAPLWLYDALFATDLPYWALTKVTRRSLDVVFDVGAGQRPLMTAGEEAFVDAMVESFMPVTERREGLANEVAAIDPTERIPIEKIAAPTLIIHARDDGITAFSNAEFTAAGIAHAQFQPLPHGGHLLLGHHDEVASQIAAFLDANAPGE